MKTKTKIESIALFGKDSERVDIPEELMIEARSQLEDSLITILNKSRTKLNKQNRLTKRKRKLKSNSNENTNDKEPTTSPAEELQGIFLTFEEIEEFGDANGYSTKGNLRPFLVDELILHVLNKNFVDPVITAWIQKRKQTEFVKTANELIAELRKNQA